MSLRTLTIFPKFFSKNQNLNYHTNETDKLLHIIRPHKEVFQGFGGFQGLSRNRFYILRQLITSVVIS